MFFFFFPVSSLCLSLKACYLLFLLFCHLGLFFSRLSFRLSQILTKLLRLLLFLLLLRLLRLLFLLISRLILIRELGRQGRLRQRPSLQASLTSNSLEGLPSTSACTLPPLPPRLTEVEEAQEEDLSPWLQEEGSGHTTERRKTLCRITNNREDITHHTILLRTAPATIHSSTPPDLLLLLQRILRRRTEETEEGEEGIRDGAGCTPRTEREGAELLEGWEDRWITQHRVSLGGEGETNGEEVGGEE